MIYIIDANNFFVSCERVYRPALRGKPVVVVSRNEACIIARSNEAKMLGFSMGEPVQLCADKLAQHRVYVVPGRVSLYKEISARIHTYLWSITPDNEPYSIDEHFIALPDTSTYHLIQQAQMIRQLLLQGTGIPVSIGIARSKTLAKLALYLGKKKGDAITYFHEFNEDCVLKTISVDKLWGVGAKRAVRLRQCGCRMAYDVKYAAPAMLKKRCTVYGAQLQAELRGYSVYAVQTTQQVPQSICRSASFGKQISCSDTLFAKLSCHLDAVATHCMKQTVVISTFTFFLEYRRAGQCLYALSQCVSMPFPNANVVYMMPLLKQALTGTSVGERPYTRAGIVAIPDVQHGRMPLPLEGASSGITEKAQRVDQAIVQIQQKWGKQAVVFAHMKSLVCKDQRHGVANDYLVKQSKNSMLY